MAIKQEAKQSSSDPLWFKDAIIYEVHVRAFQDSDGDGMGDFRGLTQRLPYLADLGVTALWILPFCPSPWKDDGYDISDYTNIHPSYGTLRDFQVFLAEAHTRGLRVISELVLNHTSDQHVWFQRSRRAAPGTRWREYYVWSDTPERYTDARIIFKDFESSNWSWDPIAKSYYWHRFYAHQPDLNYDNPEVRTVMMQMVDFWFDMGVDGLRLDAVPYLYEREGTDCENLAETHAYLRDLRTHIDARYSDRMLLAEANQWPEDAIRYFGDGDECHMAFHFPLMPRLFMATRMGDRYPITDILQLTPQIPESTQWALFLRNHDELTLEMVTDEERDYMYRVYAHDRTMRINLGIRRRLAPLLENDRRRVELLNGLLFSLPGSPVIYYGDEIGMGDNFYLGDRNGVRTPMQWSRDRNAGFSTTNPQRLYLPVVIDPEYHYEALNVENQQNNANSLLWWMKRLISQRKQSRAFGRGALEFLYPENRRVLAFIRSYEDERILVVANLARAAQCCHVPLQQFEGMAPYEMFGNTEFPAITQEPYFLSLGPHAFYWFSLRPKAAERELLRSPGNAGDIPTFAVASWEAVLSGQHRRAIERYMPQLLRSLQWFQGRSRTLIRTVLQDLIPFPLSLSWVVFFRFEYSAGDPELYVLSLSLAEGERAEQVLREAPSVVLCHVQAADGRTGILYGGSRNPLFRDELISAVSRRKRFNGEDGAVIGVHTNAYRRIWQHDPNLTSKLCKADQDGTSITYGDRFILKLFRRAEPGLHPELEIGQALSSLKERPHVAQLGGWLEYRQRDGEILTLGVVHEFIANETTGWTFTTDSLGVYFETGLAQDPSLPAIAAPEQIQYTKLRGEAPDQARTLMGSYLDLIGLLGRRTAELHLALANVETSDFAPEPFSEFYRLGLYHALLGQKNRSFQVLRTGLGDRPPETREDGESLLRLETEINSRLRRFRDRRISGKRIRIHGDYDLKQVLFTGKDFYIIDFEGEVERSLSERRIKRSPLRDVAGMMHSLFLASHGPAYGHERVASLQEAPQEVVSSLAGQWYRWAVAEFLRGYLRTSGIESLIPATGAELTMLLDTLLLETAMRELTHDLADRPDRVRLSVRSLLYLLETQTQPENAA